MQDYKTQIQQLSDPSFQQIRGIAYSNISHLSNEEDTELYNQLNRGIGLLDSHEQMCKYLHAFGNMHQAKLLDAFQKLPAELWDQPFEIIDWGCGQAMGTVNLCDYLKEKGLHSNIKKITLIEPSVAALERGILHTSAYISDSVVLESINVFFENVAPEQLKSESNLPQLHVFSNILDVAQIDLKHLATLINSLVLSDNYLVCVGPMNPTNTRIDAFLRYFNKDSAEKIYEFESYDYKEGFMTKSKTCKVNIYKLEPNTEGHLIPIEFYPTVQFHAAYELDLIGLVRKTEKLTYNEKLTHFEVAAPFDLGASVYDDVHSVLAVANNIISRGLPTKASILIEEQFLKAFGLVKKNLTYGEIFYKPIKEFDIEKATALFLSHLDESKDISKEQAIELQLLLTPIAIARFQKVLIEAIITGQLSMEEENWKIMVEEMDVPFAALALKDFETLFFNLAQLSEKYQDFCLPHIDLHIQSNPTFITSQLHLDADVKQKATKEWLSNEYDMVVTQSLLKGASFSIESFSKFECKNNCYFNIRTINQSRTRRVIYTSNRIHYKDLVAKDNFGNYREIEETKEHLTYFLQLLFRKESFRPGQLPILDRALKNLPVIGLLPTGGGKSLTYQIAALLQPGVTLIIDPLKSLMKDQYDDLISSGIDCAAYINSTLSISEKREREKQLVSSQLMFVFLSPERLSIASFRERLKNMHEYNVYFSYGVIDEVHCVSEWGHDFRFSYLHLGRNLYSYVRAKEKEISLFGLTATASFDVLADVERELSGNGAFNLDADVIVRYENTNRYELQYKIEKVPVEFETDRFYDKYNKMPSHLPKALNITNHWPQFDSKSDYLNEYISKIPIYINEIQDKSNIQYIKEQFIERQNNNEGTEEDLIIEMPDDYYSTRNKYQQAGIVFCPHVNSTGLSVIRNTEKIRTNVIPDVGSFSGKDTDDSSMLNLDKFRDNRTPLMVATKAFGMGINKPNVRFTINMNYSSSLESFVQEAGRAGRDRKMALSVILLSDYKLAKINRTYDDGSFSEIRTIRNKWFHESELRKILKHFNKEVPENEIIIATPATDIVKLHCKIDNRIFGFNKCMEECERYNGCKLASVSPETKGWKAEYELIQELHAQNIKLSRKYFQYLNPDYQTVMYFFNEAFKGDKIEIAYMNRLLNRMELNVHSVNNSLELTRKKGFLNTLSDSDYGTEVLVYIPYIKDEDVMDKESDDTSINRASDLSKAIYRMCCIELIVDFTQDYRKQEFRIVAVRKGPGDYYNGLLGFLTRYYTRDRAIIELEKVKNSKSNYKGESDIAGEIYRCLTYLTEFVYDKISEKRKRAIDDMRNFCIDGLNEKDTWLESNELLKDYIYYYFNSKYAKSDYIAENGEPFSLLEDTEGGKKSDELILFKYLRVIDDDIVGVGTPIDNVKHLYGAVRLISRSLTDSNPALALLECFCLSYMGTRGNKNLEDQLAMRYSEGLIESSERASSPYEFWDLFEKYNKIISTYLEEDQLSILKQDTSVLIHTNQFKKISTKFLA